MRYPLAMTPSRLTPPELTTRLDALRDELASDGYSGIHIVGYDDDVVYERGIGYADRAAEIAYTGETIVAIGSLTKQFTAALFLILEQDGLISAGDTLSRFFDDVPDDKRLITMHHLLTHTAGLASDFADDYDPVATREWYVDAVLTSELQSTVGTTFAYSNAGFSMVAAVLEIVSGTPYDELLREKVLDPAGLVDTGGVNRRWPAQRIAHGYTSGDDWGTAFDFPHAPDGPFWNLRGNGGLQSTAPDMLRWHTVLQQDRLLPAVARTRLEAPFVPERDHYAAEDDVPYLYGYGWSTRITNRGTRCVRHDGGDDINFATLRRFPDEGVAFFLASNQAERQAPDVAPRVEAAIFSG